jgi:hypothetical protein
MSSSEPLTESGDGSAYSDTESLVWHILRLPKVSSAATGRERVVSETGPLPLVGAYTLKRRRVEDSSRVDDATLSLSRR